MANESDVSAVVDDMGRNAAKLSEALRLVTEDDWDRSASRRGGERITIEANWPASPCTRSSTTVTMPAGRWPPRRAEPDRARTQLTGDATAATAASSVSVTGTMRSNPVVWRSRVSVGRLHATATSPPCSRRPPDAADEGTEAGRVHERHIRQVDHHPGLVGQLAERIAEARPPCRRRARRRGGRACGCRCGRLRSRARRCSIRVTGGGNTDGTQALRRRNRGIGSRPLTGTFARWSPVRAGR